MPAPTYDPAPIVVAFAVLICVVSVATALLFNHGRTQIPDNAVAEMVYNFIHDHDVWPLSQKRHSSDADARLPITLKITVTKTPKKFLSQ